MLNHLGKFGAIIGDFCKILYLTSKHNTFLHLPSGLGVITETLRTHKIMFELKDSAAAERLVIGCSSEA